MKHFVIMGVTSCGKSTVARRLAKHFNATKIEADALHGSENIAKMQRGEALNDDDRWPWLIRVGTAMRDTSSATFVSCSALRRVYRQTLIDNAEGPIVFIHLHADRDVIAKRMAKRKGHFMPLGLLDSQMETLELLDDDETGVVIDLSQTLNQVVNEAIVHVKLFMQADSS